MKIRLNGEMRTVADETSLGGLLRELGIEPGQSGVAVAVNTRVISRHEVEATPLAEGDRVEIVRAVQGG
jgi:sulfur carrier protein